MAAAVATPLLLRARRRSAWEAAIAAAAKEVAWFARTLVPDLRAARTAEAIRGAWSVSERQVAAIEDRLTALVASSPSVEERARAVTLRDGVRAARTRVRTVIESGTLDAGAELDAVAADLETALAPEATSAAPPT